jgi:hypothetical protein
MMTQLKLKKMKKVLVGDVKKVMDEVILDKVTQLIEEMSTNEFVDMIMDKLYTDGMKYTYVERETIQGMIGDRVLPLFIKITEFTIGKEIPTE